MTDNLQPPSVSAVASGAPSPAPSPAPAPAPPPPSVSTGSGQPPATGAPPDSGSTVVAPTPQGSDQQPDQESHFSKVAHNIFQALAGGPERTLDENGNWQTKQLTRGGIARGVIAGALAGMFAGVQRGPGKYPGGPVEAFGKGGQAGFQLSQFQREQQIQNQKIKQDAQLRQAQIFEANSRNMLNEANITKANLENNKEHMLLNQLMASQLEVDPSNFWGDDQTVHTEDELKEAIKSGKVPPGSYLGVKVGKDENGGLYKVVTNPDAKFTLTPEMYDMAASINPTQYPLIHKDGTPLTDAEKKQTWRVGDFMNVIHRGIGGYDIPNQYLGVIKGILKDTKDPLADRMPDKIDPKYMPAWLQVQKDLAYAHMTGKGTTAILDNLDATSPFTGLPAVPESLKNQIFASLGGGDVALGREILQAEQNDVVLKQKAREESAKREADLANPKNVDEIDARLSEIEANPSPDTDAEYRRLTKLRDQQIADAAAKSGAQAQKRQQMTGADVKQALDTGYNPTTHKPVQYTDDYVPGNMIINVKTGDIVPHNDVKNFAATEMDKRTAKFAQSSINAINQIQDFVKKAQMKYGPIMGPIREWMVKNGIANRYDQEMTSVMTLGSTATVAAHVGGRFNIPIMDEMRKLFGSNMNRDQIAGLDAVKRIMEDYVKSGGNVTVSMYKKWTQNQRNVYLDPQGPITPPSNIKKYLTKEGQIAKFTYPDGKSELWTMDNGQYKLIF